MNNIELYINNQLCEIANADKLGIRLNRVLIKPAELNTKDAQYSYSITVPASDVNDRIFGYANVEEVKDKFNQDYNAMLYVDSILVFDGKFRMSEIDNEGNYKGNLLIPAKKTVKELFGDIKMNELKTTWNIKFKEMVSSLNSWNAGKMTSDCFFPYVLYGLLPKVPLDVNGNYSSKNIWDTTVRLGIEDFPPSINCLETVKKIFSTLKDNKGNPRKISGTAFDDSRLKNLYMSYSNPTDYAQEWNWGDLGTMYIAGQWTNCEDIGDKRIYETKAYEIDMGRRMMAANLFNSSITKITEIRDSGTNILHTSVGDGIKTKRESNTSIVIPKSGLYKISLDVKMNLYTDHNTTYGGPFRVISSNFGGADNSIAFRAHEVKLLRDFGTGDFGMDNLSLDGSYYQPNMPQEPIWEKKIKDEKGNWVVENEKDFPKYFPVPGKQCVQFIDPSVNEKILSGFRWGDFKGADDRFPKEKYFKNSGLNDYDYMGRILAIRSAWSWDVKYSQQNKIYSVINNVHSVPEIGNDGKPTGKTVPSGYWVYGLPEKDEDIEDLPEGEEETEDNSTAADYGCYASSKFRQILNDAKSRTGLIAAENNVETSWDRGSGRLHQIVWLNKGEHITLVTISDSGVARKSNRTKGPYGWLRQDIDFKLEISPFRIEESWIKVGNDNKGTAPMNWDDPSNFQKDGIDLVKFLPSDQKVDEWIDNFCKAFNLQLTQTDSGNFELNIKQPQVKTHISSVLDLDAKASITKRANQPLGLPAIFDIGFKINEEEEGFARKQDKGGGKIETGSLDGSTVSQTSGFSYNWFKTIEQMDKENKLKQQLEIPVISNKEVWKESTGDYREMLKKVYTNYAQRFWYKDGDKVYNLGAIWNTGTIGTTEDKAQELLIPQLTNSISDGSLLMLSYENKPNSILQTYFNVIATNESNYTDIECYLSPEEYEGLDGSKLVKLNNDLYYIAAIEGYDPLGKNKTKLKLIRKV